MQTNQILEKLQSAGVSVEPARLKAWSDARLIPSPVTVDGVTHWPEETWWQGVAAAYLFDTCGFTQAEIRIGRFYMEASLLEAKGVVSRLDWLSGGSSSIQAIENYQDSFAWAVASIKAMNGWPLLAQAEITVIHDRDGDRFQCELRRDDEDFLREDGCRSCHPSHLFVSSIEDV